MFGGWWEILAKPFQTCQTLQFRFVGHLGIFDDLNRIFIFFIKLTFIFYFITSCYVLFHCWELYCRTCCTSLWYHFHLGILLRCTTVFGIIASCKGSCSFCKSLESARASEFCSLNVQCLCSSLICLYAFLIVSNVG